MWVMMIISYFAVAYIDTGAFTKLKGKGMMPLYIILMAISCAIGSSSAYVTNFPSPADPIKDFIISIIGS